MSEYWKSTPSYWCKFCSQYVRDTALERKNHEASLRHQNNIQRSIRDLSKNKDREEREQHRAKAEVARLNGLVGGSGTKPTTSPAPKILGVKDIGGSKTNASTTYTAQDRKRHAEQLAALGVKLPEELEREVKGVGSWQTVSERVIEQDQSPDRSPADIVKEEQDDKSDIKIAIPLNKGVHKRKAEEEEEAEQAARKKAWGSRLKTYPGAATQGDDGDLDALLGGIAKVRPGVEEVKKEEDGEVKTEDADDQALSAIPDVDAPTAAVKSEDVGPDPPVVFKKRKVKR